MVSEQPTSDDADASGPPAPAPADARRSHPHPPAAASPWRGPDRRRAKTPRISRYSFFGGRRGRVRRSKEYEGSFVDVYDSGFLAALLWIALANVADSFFTLVHLQRGGTEVNLVADALLRTGLTDFVLYKSSLVGIALLVLCLHKNFRVARFGLWAAAGAYTLLIAYHLSLFCV